MATFARRTSWKVLFSRISAYGRPLHTQTRARIYPKFAAICGCASGAVLSFYIVNKYGLKSPVLAKEDADITRSQVITQTQRELRFLSFASIEYEGNIYMTPQDFLESVAEEAPRPRAGRMRLRPEEVQYYLKKTASRSKGGPKMFRDQHEKGLISYTEYLFLLCVLTKPHSGFRIAFNMFDTDGNQKVDKKEFLVLVESFAKKFSPEGKTTTNAQPGHKNIWNILTDEPAGLERIITHSQKDAHLVVPETTLMRHFFGKKGNEVLRYEDFARFMDNLQTEVLELEFSEFSKGMPSITEEEFARILLRYTILSKEDNEEYLDRLRSRVPHYEGISFKDFKEFGQFLNNLDDFAIAMRMYTYADQPISESEFVRAVRVCTGFKLNGHLVHTVFQLFDIDGDGHLSHKEFISVMKDRLHRGQRSHIGPRSEWELFRSCVKNEMRQS